MAQVGQTKGSSPHLQGQPGTSAWFREEWRILANVEGSFCGSTFAATCCEGFPELKATAPALHFSSSYGLIVPINFTNIFWHQHLLLAPAVSRDVCHRTIMCCAKNVHIFLNFRVSAWPVYLMASIPCDTRRNESSFTLPFSHSFTTLRKVSLSNLLHWNNSVFPRPSSSLAWFFFQYLHERRAREIQAAAKVTADRFYFYLFAHSSVWSLHVTKSCASVAVSLLSAAVLHVCSHLKRLAMLSETLQKMLAWVSSSAKTTLSALQVTPTFTSAKTLVQQSFVAAAGKIWALGLPKAKRPWHLLAPSVGSSVSNNWAFMWVLTSQVNFRKHYLANLMCHVSKKRVFQLNPGLISLQIKDKTLWEPSTSWKQA